MSKVDDPDPARAARFLAQLVGDAESDRVMAMTDEELLAELKVEGREPRPPESTDALVARLKARAERAEPEPRAPVVRLRPQGSLVLQVVSSVAAAAVLVVMAAGALHRENPVGLAPDDHDKAEGFRKQAFRRCEAKDWRACAELLNRAAALDPAGEREEPVKMARGEIDRGSAK